MTDRLYNTLLVTLIIYFCVAAIGKIALRKEQIEATRLHIEVLELQLEEFESNMH